MERSRALRCLRRLTFAASIDWVNRSMSVGSERRLFACDKARPSSRSRKRVEAQGLSVNADISPLGGGRAGRGMSNKAVSPRSIRRIQAAPQSSLPFGEEAKPGFRTKTAATRLTSGGTFRDRNCRRKARDNRPPNGCARPLCRPRGSVPPTLLSCYWPRFGHYVMPC